MSSLTPLVSGRELGLDIGAALDINLFPFDLVDRTPGTEVLRGTTNLHETHRPPFWRDWLALATETARLPNEN